jgi:bifunctional DNA-binding transcriptional regulator/antitoxin component of YhaV-PrlF toxin-antitoxin module
MMIKTQYDLEVGENGTVQLPLELQQLLGIHTGDKVALIKTENGFVFLPRRLVTPEVAAQISQLMNEAGMTLADLLAHLDTESENLFQERYGHLLSS